LASDVGVDVLARVFFLLREIEDVAVGIVAAVLREGPRAGASRLRRGGVLLHALEHGRDVVDQHAEMIDAADITVAPRNDVEPTQPSPTVTA
jgi:hypothetical protein